MAEMPCKYIEKKGEIMVFNRQKTLDLLQEKEQKLAELMSESASAVQMVQQTIENLDSVNKNIESTMGEIDTYLQRLNETRAGLDQTYAKNRKIMSNFSALLCVE